jgi:hypothetical protein
MSNCSDLRLITKKRLSTTEILIKAEEWECAVYIMGYVLECGLKAVICKKLNLFEYPDKEKDPISSFFKTHQFDRLLVLSGLRYIFSDKGPIDAYRNWSEFTIEYIGDWTSMRYSTRQWDEQKVKNLYTNLTDPNSGILTILKKKW